MQGISAENGKRPPGRGWRGRARARAAGPSRGRGRRCRSFPPGAAGGSRRGRRVGKTGRVVSGRGGAVAPGQGSECGGRERRVQGRLLPRRRRWV